MKLKATHDGSYTLYNEGLDETYHSIHGARQEALHVFIENGLKTAHESKVRILEIGLGTGLNAMLTYMNKEERSIEYIGLEPYPIQSTLLQEYIELNANNARENEIWRAIMLKDVGFNLEAFSFQNIQLPILSYKTENYFDLVYFDAFAPNKQNEMWTLEVFDHLLKLTQIGGKLVTYCAQGQFKRNLKEVGFEVKALPGPPGKREMTVGIKL